MVTAGMPDHSVGLAPVLGIARRMLMRLFWSLGFSSDEIICIGIKSEQALQALLENLSGESTSGRSSTNCGGGQPNVEDGDEIEITEDLPVSLAKPLEMELNEYKTLRVRESVGGLCMVTLFPCWSSIFHPSAKHRS